MLQVIYQTVAAVFSNRTGHFYELGVGFYGILQNVGCAIQSLQIQSLQITF